MSAIVDIGAVIVDCQDAAPVSAFYQAACGGEIFRREANSVWLRLGGMTVIFREVAGYQAPTWPFPDVPMQVHLDFSVDDLEQAEALLHQLGATTPDYQPHRENGLVVMRDPAGHLFWIGTRV